MARRAVLVFDASPLIALAASGVLEALDRLGLEGIVPEQVRDEVVTEGLPPGHPEQLLLKRLFERRVIAVARVRDEEALRGVAANPRLSRADAASLCLAVERRARLVSDDRDLRAAARALGVPLGGSLYVLALAVESGVLTPRGAVEAVEAMIARGWYCSPALLKAFADRVIGNR